MVFESTRGGNVRDLYVKDTSGSAAEKLLYKSDQSKGATDWSANGRFVLFNSADPKTNRDMWALPLSRGGIPFVTLKTPFEERWAQLSPESRWLVYMSNESGRREVYVRAFAEANVAGRHTGGQWQVSNVGGIFPRWAPNGREVYYIGPKGEMMAAAITVAGDDLEVGTPSVLFQTQIVGGGVDNGQGLQFDVARDGRFLINSVVQGPSTPITLVHSWQPARRNRVLA